MKASNQLIEKIKEFEGLRLRAYRDSGGKPTIGYGHTLGVKMGQRITELQAEEMLRQDLWVAGRFANTIKEIDTQGKYDAVVSFIFNLGVGSFKRSTLYKHIKHHAPDKLIQAEFRRWTHSGGKVLPGLVKRREWEAKRWAE
ncbi:lysozyme [Hallella colorans]|uniref:lysozyme n=1 Tax=Hallella colorans TaxID=1703337 RepID=UPI0023F17E2B|nr:lysozyme [Hallella colorans]